MQCFIWYSTRQKSWPVIHRFDEKIYKTVSKVYILVDIHRGRSNTSIWPFPPPEYDSFLNPGRHADYLSLPDVSFRNLMRLKVLAFFEGQDPPQGPCKHIQLILDSAEKDLHSSTAALLSSFEGFFLTWSHDSIVVCSPGSTSFAVQHLRPSCSPVWALWSKK